MNFTATEISLDANETNFWTFLTLFLRTIGFIGLIFNLLIILTVRKQDKEKSPSGLAVQLLAIWNSVAILGDTFLEIVLSIFEAKISDKVHRLLVTLSCFRPDRFVQRLSLIPILIFLFYILVSIDLVYTGLCELVPSMRTDVF